MSLLTRCPACITLYRVVPDQLRISDGWVKCGQCGDIFDASQHLVEEANDATPSSEVSPDTTPDADAPETTEFEDTLWINPSTSMPAAVSQAVLDPDVALRPEDEPVPVSPAQMPDDAPAELTGEDQQTDVVPEPDQAQLRWNDDPSAPLSDVTPAADEIPPVAAPVTFLNGADRPLVWQKPLVRKALMLFCLLLGLSLLVQWAYLERDRLAAQHPELQPLFQAVCGVANCQVQPLKRIESLSVDSVGFRLLGNDTYRLTFTIKNASMLPLAMPNVELTLTDTGDQAVFRRVFSPNDLPTAPTHMAAGGEWPASLDLRVKPTAPEQRVLGYRLLVFYP